MWGTQAERWEILQPFAFHDLKSPTVEIEGHLPADYKKGTSFVESYDTYHKGTNKGDTDVVLFVVYLDGDGQPLAVKKIMS